MDLMRDRLVKMLAEGRELCEKINCEGCRRSCKGLNDCIANVQADHLIANGVIVPPCKMGDTLYRVVTMGAGVQRRIIRHKHSGMIKTLQYETKKNFIRKIVVTKNNFLDVCKNFDKTVFSTKEEAERALKGGD